jgi:alcohol dehydrogenase (cytochrome c)
VNRLLLLAMSTIPAGVLIAIVSAAAEPATELFTAAQADRGGRYYAERCASCHGATFGGSNGSPALKGPEFAFGWSGKPVRELYDYIRTKMPPGMIGVLDDPQYADVTACILAANGQTAGPDELGAGSPAMDSALVLSR